MPDRPGTISFVGDYPTFDDMMKGKPMSGPAGRIFDSILRSANIDRESVHVTNLFDTTGGEDGDFEKWLKEPERLQAALARLEEEWTPAQPNVIVPLGSGPLWALTGQTQIRSFRGAAMTGHGGRKLVPAYHPEMVRLQWKFIKTTIDDFIKAADEADRGPALSYPDFKVWIEPTLDDISLWVDRCAKSDLVSPDIETGWGQITCIGFADSENEAICIPFVDLRKPDRNYWRTAREELEAWKMVRAICQNPAPKVGQNLSYDIQWLLAQKGIGIRNYRRDTRLQHKVMFPEMPADLATMTATYTRVGAYKHWGGGYKKEEKKDG